MPLLNATTSQKPLELYIQPNIAIHMKSVKKSGGNVTFNQFINFQCNDENES